MICNLLNCKIYNLDGQAVYFETRYISDAPKGKCEHNGSTANRYSIYKYID